MKILYIDTTTSYLYIGLVVDGKLLGEVKENYGKDLSKFALPKIAELLEKNDQKPNDIHKIIVVNGPGSFTGIRVGVAIVKTYAYSLKKEVIEISSLEAMALSSKTEAECKIPIIDARRGYVYGAIYNKELKPILKAQYMKLDTLKCAVDNLVDRYQYISNDSFDELELERYHPDILKIVNTYANRDSSNPHAVSPIYLKQTEAEEKLNLEII